MEVWQILILAVVQGVAEFLPISSSGHIVVLAAAMSGGDPRPLDVAEVNIFLHVGTLLSILVFYWQRIWRLLGKDRRTIGLLVVGTIPAVAAGIPIKTWGSEALLSNPLLTGAMLVLTGLMLLWLGTRPAGRLDYPELSYRQATLIGISQAAAILPGISRSGATIASGVGLGLRREAAATFSFLLAIPVIGGAGILELKDLLDADADGSALGTPLPVLLLGAAIAFVVGLVALRWLLNWLRQGRIQRFAYWCIPLGILVVIWQLAVGS